MGINQKKRSLIPILCIIILLFGCTPKRSSEKEDSFDMRIDDIWYVKVISYEITDNLSTTLAVVSYGGDIEEKPYEAKPEEGKMFLLVEMLIEKQGVGKDIFEWGSLELQDTGGNIYKRHPNDTFLENMRLSRIKSSDLNLGKNEGYVCFEIDQSSMDGTLTMRYGVEESMITLPIQE